MVKQSIIVLDDFYEDPEEVRRIACSLKFTPKENATYPGLEAFIEHPLWLESRKKLRSYINESVDYESPLTEKFLQGKFRLAFEKNNYDRPDYVHEDMHRWSGIIYLALPEDCKGGIALYRHKKSGALSSNMEWYKKYYPYLFDLKDNDFKKALIDIFNDKHEWEQIGEIPMLYNRAILLMSQCFHGSTGLFGSTVENGRLTQNFQFFSEKDGL